MEKSKLSQCISDAITGEIHEEMQYQWYGVAHGTHPWAPFNASSRAVMWSSQREQTVTIMNPTEFRFKTGIDVYVGAHSFPVKTLDDIKVFDYVDKYPAADGFTFNPTTFVVFEELSTGNYSFFEIPYYHSLHPYFGFKYNRKPEINALYKGATVRKDTIFADSPGKHANGGYGTGREINVAHMSHVMVSEDSIGMSKSCAEKYKFNTFPRYTNDFDKHDIPLNTYGKNGSYAVFPEIGGYVREDGIIMASRKKRPLLSPIDMSRRSLSTIDMIHDKKIYSMSTVTGEQVESGKVPRGRIVDISVYRIDADMHHAPTGTTEQMDKYALALRKYYTRILNMESKILRLNPDAVFNPELVQQLMTARKVVSMAETSTAKRVTHTYKRKPIGPYYVSMTVEHEITPTVGHKFTGFHGNKGVVCTILEDENMPRDAEGNVADVVMTHVGVINRLNTGQIYEGEFGAAIRDMSRRARLEVGLPRHEISLDEARVAAKNLYYLERDKFNVIFKRFLKLYRLMDKNFYEFYANRLVGEEPIDHMAQILANGPNIVFTRVNGPLEGFKGRWKSLQTILRDPELQPVKSKLTYKSTTGREITTVQEMIITKETFVLLEKIGTDWSAIAHVKQQHNGMTATLAGNEKYYSSWRKNPARAAGETENRLLLSYGGPGIRGGGRLTTAEAQDRANSLATQRAMTDAIMRSPNPGYIDIIVDRKVVPFGGSRPLQILHHVMSAKGATFTYVPEEENYGHYSSS